MGDVSVVCGLQGGRVKNKVGPPGRRAQRSVRKARGTKKLLYMAQTRGKEEKRGEPANAICFEVAIKKAWRGGRGVVGPLAGVVLTKGRCWDVQGKGRESWEG